MLPNLTTFIWLFNTCAGFCMHLKSADRFICFKEIASFMSLWAVVKWICIMRCGNIEDAYLQCGSLDCMIMGLVKCGKGMQHYALYWQKLYDRVEPNCVTLMQCIVEMEQWLQRVCWSWTTCIELVVPYVSLWAVGILFEFTVLKKNSKISRSFCGQCEYSAWKKYCSRLQQKPPVFFSWQEYWEFFLYSVNWTNYYL